MPGSGRNQGREGEEGEEEAKVQGEEKATQGHSKIGIKQNIIHWK